MAFYLHILHEFNIFWQVAVQLVSLSPMVSPDPYLRLSSFFCLMA
jgi:hypothetical protein